MGYGSRVNWLAKWLYSRGYPWTERVEDDDLQAFLEVVVPLFYDAYLRGIELEDLGFAHEELRLAQSDAHTWECEADHFRGMYEELVAEKDRWEDRCRVLKEDYEKKIEEAQKAYEQKLDYYRQFDKAIRVFEAYCEAARVSPSRANLIKERHAAIFLKHEARRIKEEGPGDD